LSFNKNIDVNAMLGGWRMRMRQMRHAAGDPDESVLKSDLFGNLE